jgi:hypothetical protein
MTQFFGFVHDAYRSYAATGNDSALQKAAQLFDGQYGRPNPMRDYLYLRVSQKEPFDLLYFTPALTTILNLRDRSFTLSPEVAYTGITNLDLRLKARERVRGEALRLQAGAAGRVLFLTARYSPLPPGSRRQRTMSFPLVPFFANLFRHSFP